MLPPERLRQIIAELSQIADELEAYKARPNYGRVFLLDALHDLAAAVLNGMPEPEAILWAQGRHGVPLAELRDAWAASSQRRRSVHRMRQRAVIEAMTDAGYRNEDIALALDLHPKSVPRLRRELRNQKPDTNR